MRVVLDTNILVAALQSRRGASNAILLRVGTGAFETAISVPLMFEYEDVLSRPEFNFDQQRVNAILDYLAAVSVRQTIRYLWRPFLNDPKDDLILELAFNAQCQQIVTFNARDFKRSPELGIHAISPKDFLAQIGGTP